MKNLWCFLILFFCGLSIAAQAVNDTDSTATVQDTLEVKPIQEPDSIWMIGNRHIIFRYYKEVLYNGSPVKLVFLDNRPAMKGTYLGTKNGDSILFMNQINETYIFALQDINRIRTNFIAPKIGAGLVAVPGTFLIGLGIAILASDPNGLGIVFAGISTIYGVGLLSAVPVLLMQKRFLPGMNQFVMTKISTDALKNKRKTHRAMNKRLKEDCKK